MDYPNAFYFFSKARAYLNLLRSIYQNRTGKIPLPRMGHFYPTFRCNSRCRTCDVWKRDASGELGTADIEKVIRELAPLDIIKVTGGEPTMREDFIEIIELIKRHIQPYILHVGSNGFKPAVITEMVKKCAYPGLHLRISLDGYGETHNYSRGREDAFGLVLETLHRLCSLRRRYSFRIGVNYMVTDKTIADYDRVLSLCRKLRIDFIPGIPIKPFITDISGSNRKEIKPIEISQKYRAKKKLLNRSMKEKSSYPFAERFFLWAVENFIFDKQLSPEKELKFRCLELRSLIYVLPPGDVVTCGLKQVPVGNLLEQSLPEIWYGEKIDDFRKKVDDCEGCMQAAIEIISCLYYGDWFRKWKL